MEPNNEFAPNPDYAAEQAARSGQVPDKFKNEDGTVNVEALAKSYTELEKVAFSGKKEEATPEPEPTPAPQAEDAPLTPLNEMLDAPKTTVWDNVEKEAASGSLSEETLKSLRDSGVPDSIIASYTDGLQAKKEARTQAAANAVGGVDNLTKAMEFARNNFSPEQLEAFKGQLNGPTWEVTLKGLAMQAGLDINTAPRQDSVATSGPSAAPPSKEVVPFRDMAEQLAATSSPQYRTDPDYREHVAQRLRATYPVNR